jgi:hypothetical protein
MSRPSFQIIIMGQSSSKSRTAPQEGPGYWKYNTAVLEDPFHQDDKAHFRENHKNDLKTPAY